MHCKNYITALIDVLGQRHLLEQHALFSNTNDGRALLKTSKGRSRFKTILDDTYGVVCKVREDFKDAFRSLGKYMLDHPKYETLSREDQQKVHQLTNQICSFQFFADTIIIYTPLASSDELLMRFRIASMLFACMEIMLINFARGIFFRGAVEIGIGIEFPEGGIYGSVLNDAYKLESEIAQYPRVVIGDELRKIIQCRERITKHSQFLNSVNNRLDDFCNWSISEDKDGRFIVDFLGRGFAELCSARYQQSQDYVKNGFESINKKYRSASNDRNTKVAFRYSLLIDYYRKNLAHWGLD